jgi:hypothetical protein
MCLSVYFTSAVHAVTYHVPCSSRYIAVWDDARKAAGAGITLVILAGSFCLV